MKSIKISLLAAMISVTVHAQKGKVYTVPSNGRIVKTINTEWVFNYFPESEAEDGGYEQPSFDDTKWTYIAIPHTWNTYETTHELHPYIRNASYKDDPYWWLGWGWYRKRFVMGEELRGKKVTFEFDGVQKYAKIYLNGKYLGDHKGGYTSFYFDATDAVEFGRENILVVAVNNAPNDRFNIPPMNAGNWVTYGGILRDVRIVVTDLLNVPYQGSYKHEGGTFITTPKVSGQEASIHVKSYVQNKYGADRNARIVTVITDAQNKVIEKIEKTQTVKAGEIAEFVQDAKPLKKPNLWNPETPYVYNLYTEVYDGTRLADVYSSTFGIRSIAWDYDIHRLILNGKATRLHGINRHEEYIWLGQAFPKWIADRDMSNIKHGLEVNFMRTSHYPNDPSVYGFMDYNGICIDEEAPNNKSQQFDKQVQEWNCREMIRRDRNHPSILFWCMGNETTNACDSRIAWEEDTTRILTVRQPYSETYNPEFCRHISDKEMPIEAYLRCTIRGWYDRDEADFEPDDLQWAGTDYWQHFKSRDFASDHSEAYNKLISDFNGSVWLYADHGADREYVNAPLKHVNPKGWVDSWRTPKYVYYLWQANLGQKAMVHIQPHFWREHYLGMKRKFTVDSNCETVELFVNGKRIGSKNPTKESQYVVEFDDVEVVRGVIEVVGTAKDGRQVRDKVVMAGKPARLTLEMSHKQMMCTPDNVTEFKVDVVDKDGVHVYGANPTLKFQIDGPAKLIGPDVYISDREKNGAYEGTMYIDAPVTNLIRGTGHTGQVTVTVTAQGLESSSATIEVLASSYNQYPIKGITEPPLPLEGREQVKVNPLQANFLPAPEEMKFFSAEISFPKSQQAQYRTLMQNELVRLNPNIDPKSIEFQYVLDAFMNIFLATANNLETQGYVVTDDANFLGGQYNLLRAITTYLQAKDLPQAWKDEMTRYYADMIIAKGYDRNYMAERTKIDRIPTGGGKAVYVGTGSGRTDVTEINETNLKTLLVKLYPEVEAWPDSDKTKACVFIMSFNPEVYHRGDEVFDAAKDKIILIPNVATISQNLPNVKLSDFRYGIH